MDQLLKKATQLGIHIEISNIHISEYIETFSAFDIRDILENLKADSQKILDNIRNHSTEYISNRHVNYNAYYYWWYSLDKNLPNKPYQSILLSLLIKILVNEIRNSSVVLNISKVALYEVIQIIKKICFMHNVCFTYTLMRLMSREDIELYRQIANARNLVIYKSGHMFDKRKWYTT